MVCSTICRHLLRPATGEGSPYPCRWLPPRPGACSWNISLGIVTLWEVAGTKRLGEAGRMTPEPAAYPGYRFPAEVIRHAVWLYHLFSFSLRDIELILAERGILVTYESIRRWVLKFGAEFAGRLRKRRPRPGDTWHLDECS